MSSAFYGNNLTQNLAKYLLLSNRILINLPSFRLSECPKIRIEQPPKIHERQAIQFVSVLNRRQLHPAGAGTPRRCHRCWSDPAATISYTPTPGTPVKNFAHLKVTPIL